VMHQRVGRDDLTLVDTYNATEGGVYAATDYGDDPSNGLRTRQSPHAQVRSSMLMIPDRGVFFELVPAEEHDSDSPRRVPLWEVEPDRVYAIVVTTPSGLYAYKLGDLVRFTSLRPLRVEFVGRVSGCLSTTQELTTHAEIEQAVASALVKHPGTAVDFAAGADVGVAGSARSRYVLFVEFTPGGRPPDEQGFAAAFDQGLCQANRVYREHRNKDAAILPPEVVFLPPGSVRRFLGEARSGNVQSKFPRVVDDEYKGLLRSYAAEAG
jgi:GH3 auxin-responsive promoter